MRDRPSLRFDRPVNLRVRRNGSGSSLYGRPSARRSLEWSSYRQVSGRLTGFPFGSWATSGSWQTRTMAGSSAVWTPRKTSTRCVQAVNHDGWWSVFESLRARRWKLKLIVSTHGHWVQVGDNAAA